MEFKFKTIREDLDLKQHEIAHAIGVSRSNYSLIEANKSNIKLKIFINYCEKYNYSMDYVANLTPINDTLNIIKIQTVDKKVLSQRLRQFEKNEKIKSKTIAKLLGIQPSTYASYKSLKVKNIIQTLMLKELSINYGYSMDWFVGRSNKMKIK